MDPPLAGAAAVTVAGASSGSTFWIASLLALAAAIIAYVSMGGGRRRVAAVRRLVRRHVRREPGRFVFESADVSSVELDAGIVVLADASQHDAARVAVVDRGAHLGDGRAALVRLGMEGDQSVDRVMRFPSRLAVEAFQDTLLYAQNRVDAPRPTEVTLSLNTWNVGNAQPPADLSSWFDATRGASVVAFGTQECSYSTKPLSAPPSSNKDESLLSRGGSDDSATPLTLENAKFKLPSADASADGPELAANNLSGKAHWQAVVRAHFPNSDYVTVAELASWDRCLSVFVRKELAYAVSQVRSDTAFVGLGGVAGNKGAIGVRFAIFDTDFVIINSHLAAHQGHVTRRNQDYSVITSALRSLRDGPTVDVLTSKAHHLFWMGDLNYRIELPRDDVLAKAAEKDFKSLFEADQLRKSMAAGDAFVGFDEARITFPPTYRYERGNRKYASTKMRIPSYCDRILKRSLPGLSATVNTYTSVDTIMTSDHSPVTATVTAELAHTSGLRSLDDIEASFREPENVDREVTLGLDSSSPQGVVAGALGIVKGGYNDLEDVTFVLEFTSLSACNLPEMDGAAQGAANMVAQTMVGSGGAARVSTSAEGGTVTAGYGATDTAARGGEPGVAGSADKARGEGDYNGLGYCDPYCVFHGDGVAELAEGQYETAVLKATQKPRWNVTSQVPKVALLDDVDSLLRCRYLTITVMDEDVGSADDVVGNVVLWLGDGWLTAPEEGGVVARAEFSVYIQYDGLRRGKLSGSYVIRRTKLAATAALCGAVSGL